MPKQNPTGGNPKSEETGHRNGLFWKDYSVCIRQTYFEEAAGDAGEPLEAMLARARACVTERFPEMWVVFGKCYEINGPEFSGIFHILNYLEKVDPKYTQPPYVNSWQCGESNYEGL